MAKSRKKKRRNQEPSHIVAYFNELAQKQAVSGESAFLEALATPEKFANWLREANPSLEDLQSKISSPKTRVVHRNRKGRHKTKEVKKVANRHSRLLLALCDGRLNQLAVHFKRRHEPFGKSQIASAHSQGVRGVLVAMTGQLGRELADYLHKTGHAITRKDLFRLQNKTDATGNKLPENIDPGLVGHILTLAGDRLSKADLLRHNAAGNTLLAYMINKGQADLVVSFLTEDPDRLTIQDLQIKRGENRICLMDALFLSASPDVLLHLPLDKGRYLPADFWQQINARFQWNSWAGGTHAKYLESMKKIAHSKQWLKLPPSAFEAFASSLDPYVQDKIGLWQVQEMQNAQRAKRLIQKYRRHSRHNHRFVTTAP